MQSIVFFQSIISTPCQRTRDLPMSLSWWKKKVTWRIVLATESSSRLHMVCTILGAVKSFKRTICYGAVAEWSGLTCFVMDIQEKKKKERLQWTQEGEKTTNQKNPPSFPAADILLNDIAQLLSGLGRIGKHIRIWGYNANSKSNI